MRSTKTNKFILTPSRAIILWHLLSVTEPPTYYEMRDLISEDLRGIIRSLINAGMATSLVRRGEVYYRLTYRGYLLAKLIDPKTMALPEGAEVPEATDITDECRYNWRNLWVFQIMGSGARKSADKVKQLIPNGRNPARIERSGGKTDRAA